MIYKYEMACREAGLSEEKTAEIRRMFDAEYKKLKRRKKRQEEEKRKQEEAKKALDAAKGLFGGGSTENMPTAEITDEIFKDGKVDLISLLVASGLVNSRSEGRRAIEQGGVTVNNEKVTDIAAAYEKNSFDEEFVLKRGKKNFRKIIMK